MKIGECIGFVVFQVTRVLILIRPGRESDSEAEDIEHAEKLHQVKAVLEEVANSLLPLCFLWIMKLSSCFFAEVQTSLFYFHE